MTEDFNIEAEQLLLGAIMLDNSVYWKACMLEPDDFYEPVHQRLFTMIREKILQAQEASPVMLRPLFEEDEAMKDMGGGYSYMMKITGLSAGFISVRDFVTNLQELSAQRKLKAILLSHLEGPINSEKLLSEIISVSGIKIANLKKRRLVMEEKIHLLQQDLPCYATGIEPLDDNMLGGMYQGKTYCIAGKAKGGKTLLLGTISYNMSQAGVSNVYVALEMGEQEITDRDAARAAGRNAMAFVSNRGDKAFQQKIAEVASNENSEGYFIDKPGITFDELKARLYSAVKTKAIKGIFLDYIQIIEGKQKNQSDADFFKEVAQWLANFARREKIFVCYAAQLNRDGQVYGSDGIIKAADWVYHLEMNEAKDAAWLSPVVVRYTPPAEIGNKSVPALRLNKHGPHFEDMNQPTAVEATYSLMLETTVH